MQMAEKQKKRKKKTRQDRLIAERAHALAIIHLTRRPEVTVREVTEDIGIDLLAFIKPAGRRGVRQFGIQIKGSWEAVTAARAKEILRPSMRKTLGDGPFPFPVLLFLFTMEKDQGWYTWVADPVVSPDGGIELRVQKDASCQPLDEHAVDEIVSRVNGWYDGYYARVGSLAASSV
jgi:hypothetical protein